MKKDSRRLNEKIWLAMAVSFLVLLLAGAASAQQWSVDPNNSNNIYYNSGNVGIGTTAPVDKLHVAGNAVVDPYKSFISRYTSSTAYQGHLSWDHVQLGNNGANYIVAGGGGGTGAGGSLGFVVNNTNDLAGLYATEYKTGTVAMFIASSGNVGIGTTTPGYKLDIYGPPGSYPGRVATPDGYLLFGPANAGWSHFTTDRARFYFNTGITVETGNIGSYAQDLNLQTSGTTRLTINNSTGNVGIGTASPGFKLEVRSTIPGQAAYIRSDATSGTNYGLDAEAMGSATTNIGGYFAAANAANNYAIIVPPGFGNVGIGTTTPAQKLSVAGNINVIASATEPGNITLTGTINAKYQDVAEWVPSSEQITTGTVVVLDSTKSNQVVRSTQSYDTRVAGVVSEKPGIALGESGANKVLVATTGRVLVKVDASNGSIHIGDLLVTSDIPGLAMKSEPITIGNRKMHMPGSLIGKALEPMEKGSGRILVLLSLQ